MAVPTLTAEQWQYMDDGVLLNGDSALPFVDITNVQGLDSGTARTSTTDREGLDGGWVDAYNDTIRTVLLEGTIYAAPTSLETYLDDLKANFAIGQGSQPFYIGTDLDTRLVFAKSTGLVYTKDSARRTGMVNFQTTLLCEDPRFYASSETTASLAGTLTLGGNRDTTGKIIITGTSTNPVITVGGSTFTFTYTVASGHTVTIDLGNRTILLDDGTNIRPKVVIAGGWPLLMPGANVIGFTGGGTASAVARSAWR